MRKSDFITIFILNTVLFILLVFGDFSTDGVLGFLRVGLGFIYLIFAPGYALQAALFPRREHLASLDRLALSIGLSIAIMPALGLMLDGPPGGIFLWQSFIVLTMLTAICGFIAIYRRGRLTGGQAKSDETELNLRRWWQSQTFAGRSLFVLIPMAVVLGFILVLYVLSVPSSDKQFTEFYMVSTSNVAANYPLEISAGQPFTVKVGVINREGKNISYSIDARMNGKIVAGTAPFTLVDDQSISLDIAVVGSTAGDQQLLEILLLRDNQVYRRLYLWLNVKSS
jgi:uncharacterized membrane protein